MSKTYVKWSLDLYYTRELKGHFMSKACVKCSFDILHKRIEGPLYE